MSRDTGAEANADAGLPYRADIDGLRAIAVLLVLGFHAFPGKITGGFIGVDVFFVISGYLITGIIAEQTRTGKFSLVRFYAARVRRIFPALTIVLFAVLLAGGALLVAEDYAELARQALAGAAFVSNLLLWSEAGYFDVNSAVKPLLHLWSLGIEEQYYLLWPLALTFVLRRGWRPERLILFAAIGSFVLCALLVETDPVAAFYNPIARWWELMIGALAAIANQRRAAAIELGSWAGFLGLTLIVFAAFRLDGASPFPGFWALLPTIGTALVIQAGQRSVLNRGLLSSGPFVGVGLISYPLYLWHWPILSFLLIRNHEVPPSPFARAAALLASLILALLTYWLIERAVRRVREPATPVAGAAMIAAALASTAVLISGGVPGRPANLDERARFIAAYSRYHREGLNAAYRFECDFYDAASGRTRGAIAPGCILPGKRGTLFLWGDSHAQALSAGLTAILPQGWSLAQVATSGCRPRLDATPHPALGAACDRSNRYALATIARLRPDIVLIAQERDHEMTDWTAIARRLRVLGARRVVLIGPVPQWRPSLPQIVAFRYWTSTPAYLGYGLDRDVIATDRALQSRYGGSDLPQYVALIGRLCRLGSCLAVVPGAGPRALVAVDYGHMTPGASVFVARSIIAPALRLGESDLARVQPDARR